jgi:hypothetical protein
MTANISFGYVIKGQIFANEYINEKIKNIKFEECFAFGSLFVGQQHNSRYLHVIDDESNDANDNSNKNGQHTFT